MLRRTIVLAGAAFALGATACGSDKTTEPAAPATPTGLAVSSATQTSVVLSWGAVSGATSYVIQRATGTGAFAPVGTATTTSYTDTGVQPGTAYNYQIAAVNGSKQSAFSSSVTATTLAATPGVPGGLAASNVTPGALTLSWTAVSGATGYLVQRSAAGANAFTQIGATNATTTSYRDSALAENTAYDYRVAATNTGGTSAYSAAFTARTTVAGPKQRIVTGNITTNETWSGDTTYVLNGYVKVRAPATLTIRPGARIVGDTTVPGSSLWITRGAKIDARGTATAPIVFTSQRSPGNRLPGDWGGLIIVGNALVNRSAGGGVGTMFTEGPQGTGQNTGENYGGGTDFNDNSGTLRYVRIEFGGYAVLPDQELNGLSSYAVGRGTTYEYVESMSGLDDSFEWFGGSVDGRYLVSYESGDDHFDWTEGYSGRNQYLIAFQSFQPIPRAGAGFVSKDPRGFEGDGCEIDKPGCTSYLVAPYSMPVFANFTLIGPGSVPVFSGISDNNGAVIRRGSGGTFLNGVIARWQGRGWNVRDAATDSLRKLDSLTAQNVFLTENGGGNFDPSTSTCTNSGGACGTQANFPGITGLDVPAASLFLTAFPASGATPTLAGLDWTPAPGAPIANASTTFSARVQARLSNYFGGTMQVAPHAGAAAAGGPKWWEGWTNYARN